MIIKVLEVGGLVVSMVVGFKWIMKRTHLVSY